MRKPRKVTLELSMDDLFLIRQALMERSVSLLEPTKYLPQYHEECEEKSQRSLQLADAVTMAYEEIQPDDEWYATHIGKPATKLAFWMDRKGISQQDLSEKTGLLQPAISRFCSGARGLKLARVDTVLKIAGALGKQIEEIIED